MGIDRHLILTLNRSGERQRSVLGASTALQTPTDKISFVRGHDNKDYNDDIDAIVEAAEADGFPYVRQFAQGHKNEYIAQSVSGACQVWNYSRILRHIASGTETCMVSWDDRCLTLPFPFMDSITEELQSRSEEFYLFQLRIRFGDAHYNWPDNGRMIMQYPNFLSESEYERSIGLMQEDWEAFNKTLNEKWAYDFEQFTESHYYGGEMSLSPDAYVGRHIQRNMIGLEENIIFSPKGAAWMLLEAMQMRELDDNNIPEDDILLQHAKRFAKTVWEYHSQFNPDLTVEEFIPPWAHAVLRRNTFDSWISSDLCTAIEKAIAENKGLYCPKEIGNRYIQDWLLMDSDVEWANQDNPEMETYRTESTGINFIDVP